jgi:4-cresol dehydrogenase (hydroxylating) flavoprotein subunit
MYHMKGAVLNQALESWQGILGKENVLIGEEAHVSYGSSTLGGTQRVILAALRPNTREQILSLVKVSAQHRIPLYPISTGHNWGYGSASPVTDGCVIIDLSRMNRIIAMDEKLGLVTVEPGVTSGQLHAYLQKHSIPFIAPFTSAGPGCSLIGNTLERGRSINPLLDRFASMMGIEVVLSNGTIYNSPFRKQISQPFFKWGSGPYIDGLFGQSNLGIVVTMTLALAPMPAAVENFFLSVKEDVPLSEIVDSVRNMLQKLGTTLSSVKLLNRHRVLTRISQYSHKDLTERGVLSEAYIQHSLDTASLTSWTLIGTLQGEPKMVSASRESIKRILGHTAKTLFFFTTQSHRLLTTISRYLPVPAAARRLLTAIQALHSFPDSAPSDPEMKPMLPWWRIRGNALLPIDRTTDYDTDARCGLLSFSAVLPMLGTNVELFATEAEDICYQHALEPIMTLLNLSDRCLMVSVQLLFDKSNPTEVTLAQQCHTRLASCALACGGYSYRGNIDTMSTSHTGNDDFWRIAQKIKEALDPENIIAPGRYSS